MPQIEEKINFYAGVYFDDIGYWHRRGTYTVEHYLLNLDPNDNIYEEVAQWDPMPELPKIVRDFLQSDQEVRLSCPDEDYLPYFPENTHDAPMRVIFFKAQAWRRGSIEVGVVVPTCEFLTGSNGTDIPKGSKGIVAEKDGDYIVRFASLNDEVPLHSVTRLIGDLSLDESAYGYECL